MNWCRIKSTNDRNDSTEVVEFFKHNHHFKDARNDSNTLLKVFRLDNTLLQPESELHTHTAHVLCTSPTHAVTMNVFTALQSCGLDLTTNKDGSGCHIRNTVMALSPSIAILSETRMWANAQCDGRPAECRWHPLLNATKSG